MVASIKDVEEGSIVTFRSKNATDLVQWQGVLEATGTYRSIRDRFNPAAYNAGVRQVDSAVPQDVTLLTYFMITINNNSEQSAMMVFADEWIVPGTLNIINMSKQVKITVDDPKDNPQAILSLLASAGYKTKLSQ